VEVAVEDLLFSMLGVAQVLLSGEVTSLQRQVRPLITREEVLYLLLQELVHIQGVRVETY
jgi:hypothetical protein